MDVKKNMVVKEIEDKDLDVIPKIGKRSPFFRNGEEPAHAGGIFWAGAADLPGDGI